MNRIAKIENWGKSLAINWRDATQPLTRWQVLSVQDPAELVDPPDACVVSLQVSSHSSEARTQITLDLEIETATALLDCLQRLVPSRGEG